MRKLKYEDAKVSIVVMTLKKEGIPARLEPYSILIPLTTGISKSTVVKILQGLRLSPLMYQVDEDTKEIQIFDTRL